MNLFDLISQKLYKKSAKAGGKNMTNPLDSSAEDLSSLFMNKMSKKALSLYEHQCDIKNFTKLALSNPENTSHNEMVANLLKEDILDPLSDEVIKKLASNESLLNDLDL